MKDNATNQLDSFRRFDTKLACDRQTDGHMVMANTALERRRVVKIIRWTHHSLIHRRTPMGLPSCRISHASTLINTSSTRRRLNIDRALQGLIQGTGYTGVAGQRVHEQNKL